VTITFPDKRSQYKFESLTKLDGLGYTDHQFVVASPKAALPAGVDLQICGINIVYDNPESIERRTRDMEYRYTRLSSRD
jgi:hypothetical protein